MFEFQPIPYTDKSGFYRELRQELMGMYGSIWITNLATASASLMAHLPRLNWAGFYLLHGSELILGPFQGLPACLNIPLGKGVCGRAAQTRQSLRVDDVEKFPGHIACDARSRSELVVPMLSGERLLGVLDLDSPERNRFTEQDERELEILLGELVKRTAWPADFIA